ncbi:MAG: FkbM family methyltransferase [Methanothermobacter sp.]|nr:FkbM family methyltransferase [Methanothermobacter sp.]
MEWLLSMMLNVTVSDYIRAMLFSGLLFYREEFLNVKKVFRNWLEAILFRLGLLDGFMGKLRNGENVKIANLWEYYRLLYAQMLDHAKIWGRIIEFKFNGTKLKFYLGKDKVGLLDALNVLSETFAIKPYKHLDVKRRVVVDIGSYIGDSPIYFVLMGARQVYAFEPYPNSYNLLLKNIMANNLDKRIIAFNEGLGEKVGKIKVNEDYRALATSRLKDFCKGRLVKLTNLEEIVREFNLKNACLKMDCEGCEYSILETPKSILKVFWEMIIEYHHGYMNLKEKLESAGFQVKNTKPILYRVGDQKFLMGYLHAKNVKKNF